MGQHATEPDVIGNPNIIGKKGLIKPSNPTFTYIGSRVVHALNAADTITRLQFDGVK